MNYWYRPAIRFFFFLVLSVLLPFAHNATPQAESGWVVTRIGLARTDLNTVYFLDSKRGWVGGDDGFLGRTDDGGKTWELIKNLASVEYRSCVAYVPGLSAPMLVTVGPSGSDYSVDDGRTWRRFSNEGYHTLSFAKSTPIGWAAGADGRIAKCFITKKLQY